MTNDMPINPDRVVVWRSQDGWRWHRLDADNGNVIAESGEGYTDKGHTARMAERVNAPDFVLEIEDDPDAT